MIDFMWAGFQARVGVFLAELAIVATVVGGSLVAALLWLAVSGLIARRRRAWGRK